MNVTVGNRFDVREHFGGRGIAGAGVVHHVERVRGSFIQRKTHGACIFLKSGRFRKKQMDFIDTRRHWKAAMKYAVPAAQKKR